MCRLVTAPGDRSSTSYQCTIGYYTHKQRECKAGERECIFTHGVWKTYMQSTGSITVCN